MGSFYGDAAERTDMRPLCANCGRRLAEYLTPPYSIRCPKCHTQNRVPEEDPHGNPQEA